MTDERLRGNAFRQAGNLAAAIECYRRALGAAPDDPRVLYNLGVSLYEADQPEEAELHLRRLVEIEPNDADAFFYLGTYLHRQQRHAEALPFLKTGVSLSPGNPYLWWNLGVSLAMLGSLDEARECLERTVRIEPSFHEAWFHLGHVHSLQQRRGDAERCYRAAHAGSPDSPVFTEALLFELQAMGQWRDLDRLIALRRRHLQGQSADPTQPFSLLLISTDRAEQLRCARSFAAWTEAGARASARRRSHGRDRPTGGRLHIGYLSADFSEHATSYLMAELFELHDRQRLRVTAYSYGPDDRSAMRARVRAAFDHFVDLRSVPDVQSAGVIEADGVDILVDLKGYTKDARPGILALRPAPVQASYLGYPATMGASFIDYLIADRFVVPPSHAAEYSEKLVYLPGCYQVNDRKRPRPASLSRPALGLPEGFVFCCFNQISKILPGVFDTWTRLLQAMPGSVLWLLDWNPWATENLREEAAARGINPARLVFSALLPIPQHLERIGAADLFLDTFPCNAHTTASDALWAGLPVLTRCGETFASRVCGSLLHALGLPELVTHSAQEYESRALGLARDPDALAALRRRLAAARTSSPVFDTPRFARNLESAYQRIWDVHVAGAPPRHLEIMG